MGQTNDKKAATKKTNSRRRQRREIQEIADWQMANPELMYRAVLVITAMGGAIRIGYTRDGGAYSIGVYGDGEPYTDYVRPGEDINEYLKELVVSYE